MGEVEKSGSSGVEVHAEPWLREYAARRLPPSLAREVEAHLLVCDRCFAALLAQELGLG